MLNYVCIKHGAPAAVSRFTRDISFRLLFLPVQFSAFNGSEVFFFYFIAFYIYYSVFQTRPLIPKGSWYTNATLENQPK